VVDGRLVTQGSVMAVGDDDQSIYAFRGARVGNMQDFVREFGVGRQIKLEQNYRSYSNILDSANALIAHNSRRLGKNLRTEQGPGEPVRIHEAESDLMEARWLVDEVRALAAGGMARQQIAVLYRSNAQSRVLESSSSMRACPTASMAACALSSAPRSSMRWPTCACWRTRTMTPALPAW